MNDQALDRAGIFKSTRVSRSVNQVFPAAGVLDPVLGWQPHPVPQPLEAGSAAAGGGLPVADAPESGDWDPYPEAYQPPPERMKAVLERRRSMPRGAPQALQSCRVGAEKPWIRSSDFPQVLQEYS